MSRSRRHLDFARDLGRALRHPGPPPPYWGWITAGLLVSIVAVLALLVAPSWTPSHFFAEGKIGTYLSVGYLVLDGAVCLAICWRLARASESWPDLRRCLMVFLVGLAAVMMAGLAMHVLGDWLHDRRGYYFKVGRYGGRYYLALGALVLFGGYVCWSLRRCRFTRFWFLFGNLLCLLALDDLLAYHEKFAAYVNKAWLFLPKDHPVAFHLNDVMVGLYGLVAAGLAWGYRDRLVRLPWMIITMSFACLCFAGTVAADLFEWAQWQEESLKIVAGAMILAALITAYLEITRDRSLLMGTPTR